MTPAATPPLRAGIIGLSWIGADAAEPASGPALGTAAPYSHASAMAAVGGIDLKAVCDLDPGARDSFRHRWDARWPGIDAFEDADAMLASQTLDLVSVATPDHLHAPMIRRCLAAGVPMVFSEKPFTTSLTEADELLTEIDEAGATVGINHTWRWRPEVAEAASIVGTGALGPLSQVIVEAGGPRAMLFRNLSHFIDLSIHLASADPQWVSAELETGDEGYGTAYRGDGGRDAALDPGACISIAFSNDVRAYVTGLKSSVADVVVQVVCRDGRVTIDALGGRVTRAARTGDGTPTGVSGPSIQPLRPRFTLTGMAAGLTDLIESHRLGREPSSSARSARSTVAVIDAALRSQAAGCSPVSVTPRSTTSTDRND